MQFQCRRADDICTALPILQLDPARECPLIQVLMILRFFLVFSLLIAAPALRAGEIDVAEIDARVNRLMKEPGMVGLGLVIVQDGQIIHAKGYGETLAGSGDKVTENTVFRWASLSKGVAGTLAAVLEEEGKFKLSDSASRYSSTLKLPRDGEKLASLDNVLSHRLGIVRNAYDNRLERGRDPAVIRSQLAGLPIECPVGTCHAYQNIGFDTISDAVKSVTGEAYPEAVKARLFKPLGMNSANMTLDGLELAPRWARPHNSRGVNVYRKQRNHYYRVPAAGGVNSNILDLGRWIQAQIGMMDGVVSDAARANAHTPRVGTTREKNRVRRYYPRMSTADYGLGFRVYNYAGRKVVGHRGAVNGYRGLVLFDPERKVGVGALWNSGSNQPAGLQMEVMDMAYDLPAQDWLYLGRGPNLRQIRGQMTKIAKVINAPVPRLSPHKLDDSLPPLHGAPYYTVAACFGGSNFLQ